MEKHSLVIQYLYLQCLLLGLSQAVLPFPSPQRCPGLQAPQSLFLQKCLRSQHLICLLLERPPYLILAAPLSPL